MSNYKRCCIFLYSTKDRTCYQKRVSCRTPVNRVLSYHYICSTVSSVVRYSTQVRMQAGSRLSHPGSNPGSKAGSRQSRPGSNLGSRLPPWILGGIPLVPPKVQPGIPHPIWDPRWNPASNQGSKGGIRNKSVQQS